MLARQLPCTASSVASTPTVNEMTKNGLPKKMRVGYVCTFGSRREEEVLAMGSRLPLLGLLTSSVSGATTLLDFTTGRAREVVIDGQAKVLDTVSGGGVQTAAGERVCDRFCTRWASRAGILRAQSVNR